MRRRCSKRARSAPGRGRGRGRGEEANSDLYAVRRLPPPSGAVHAARAIDDGAHEGVVKVSGAYRLPMPQERAYSCCRIPRSWPAACRAARASIKIAENEYAMRMKMVLAAVSGLFEGKVRITDAIPPRAIPPASWKAPAKSAS